MTNYEKELLQGGLTAYVQNITKPSAKAGSNMYVCPLCHSGEHGNETGAFSIKPDGKHWKCFSCGRSGDIFNLISEYEHIDGLKKQAERAAQFLGIPITEPQEKPVKSPKNDANTRGKYAQDIEKWTKNVGKTEYFHDRGFTDEDIARFQLGYDADAGAAVIPYDRNGNYYITRKINATAKNQRYRKMSGVAEPIYNIGALYDNKPCFICEGQFDAISIMTASNNTANAIALGGTGTQRLQKELKRKLNKAPLIICFDADEAGRIKTQEMADVLDGMGVDFTIASFTYEKYDGMPKDANDLLKANKRQFMADIAKNVEERNAMPKTDNRPIFGGITLQELDVAEYAPQLFLIDNVMASPALCLLSAKPKMYKSFLCLHAGLCIAAGEPFNGQKTTQAGVIYFDLENYKAVAQERLRLVWNDKPRPKDFLYLTSEDIANAPSMDYGFFDAVERLIENRLPSAKLVIIDTYTYIKPKKKKNEDDYTYERETLNTIKEWAKSHNVTVLLVHHNKKASNENDMQDDVNGSIAIAGTVDTYYIISKAKRTDDEATVSIDSKLFRGHVIKMKWNDNACKWEYLGDAAKVEAERERNEYESDIIVKAIKTLVAGNKGTWRGTAKLLIDCAMSQGIAIDMKPLSAGKAIQKRIKQLDKYDCIKTSQGSTRQGGATILYTFKQPIPFDEK